VNRKLAVERKADTAAIAEDTRKALLVEPAIAAVYTRAELESGSRKGAPFFEMVQRTWNRDVSSDLQIVLKPYWIFSSGSGSASTHGSPHPYDTQVPLLMYGTPWIAVGRVDARVEMVDLAPTLARILRLPAPSSSEGKILPIGLPAK
jgi:arylsulfatase A-like enzyme